MGGRPVFIEESALPRRLGSYVLEEQIGTGAFAQVFRGYRFDGLGGGHYLAIKVVAADTDRDSRRRLRTIVNEVLIGLRLRHPNICRLYNADEAEGFGFLVMELLDGLTLDQILRWARRQRFRLDPGVALMIAAQVADGLHHAHQHRGEDGAPSPVVHRDLKPANLMISWDGTVKLMDLGIARSPVSLIQSRKNTAAGTPAYMAPEQARGKPPRPAQDLFSLGSILYEMIAGRRLFTDPEVKAVLRRVARADVHQQLERLIGARPRLGPAVDLLRRMLARRPEDRVGTAAELAAELRALLAQYPPPVSLKDWMGYIAAARGEGPRKARAGAPAGLREPVYRQRSRGRLAGEATPPGLSLMTSDTGLVYTAETLPLDATDDALHFLGASTLFAGCDEEVLSFLLQAFELQHLEDGEVLFRAGDTAEDWFLVRAGILSVSGSNGLSVARLGVGELLGEMGVLTGAPRSATVIAEGAAEVYRMSGEKFRALKADHPARAYPLVRSMTANMCARLRRMNARLAECSDDPQRFLQDPEVAHGVGDVDPNLLVPAGVRRLLTFIFTEVEA